MCTVAGIDRNAYQTRGRALSGRVVFYLITLIAISLLLQFAYSHFSNSRSAQLSMSTISEQTQEESGFVFQGDELDYYRIAHNLLNGRGYSLSAMERPAEPTAYWPPLFPTLLAVVFLIFGPVPRYGVMVNQALIASLIPLSFWLGSSLYNNRCGIVAATIVALWPHGFYFGSHLLTEPLHTVLVLTTFGLLVKLVSSPSSGLAIAAGLAAGAATLTRSGFAVTLAVLSCWFLLRPKQQIPGRMVLIFWSAVAITLAPWSFRNYAVMNFFSPGTTGSGVVFAGAHNAETLASCPGSWTVPQIPESDVDRVAQMSEIGRDGFFWTQGLDFLSQQSPGSLLRLFVLKILRLWVPVQRVVPDEACSLCNVLSSLLFLVPVFLSVLGLLLLRSQKAIFHLGLSFLGGTTLIAIIFWGGTRFRMPLEPILWVFGAHALIWVFESRTNPEITQVASQVLNPPGETP